MGQDMFSMTDPIDLRLGCCHDIKVQPAVQYEQWSKPWAGLFLCTVHIYMRNCTTHIMSGVCRIISHEIGIPRSEPSRIFFGMAWAGPPETNMTGWNIHHLKMYFLMKHCGFQGCKSNSLPPWATDQSYGSTPPPGPQPRCNVAKKGLYSLGFRKM